MSDWVLQEPLGSERYGKPLCFMAMTGIGPATSEKPEEWMVFDSEEEARQRQPFHPLCCWEPVEKAALA